MPPSLRLHAATASVPADAAGLANFTYMMAFPNSLEIHCPNHSSAAANDHRLWVSSSLVSLALQTSIYSDSKPLHGSTGLQLAHKRPTLPLLGFIAMASSSAMSVLGYLHWSPRTSLFLRSNPTLRNS